MKKIILAPSGKTVNCEDGQTVLAALEKHGYVLPNNCRAGACGECKLKVIKGTFDQGFILDMALSSDDRAQNKGLMCMAKVTSDELEVEFETDNNGPKLFLPAENLPYILTEKILVTEAIVKLRLRSLTTSMRFWPGQYISIGSKELNIPFKSYSIANIPNHDGEIILYITKSKTGTTSKWIHEEFKVGQKIKVNGPYGTFIGDPRSELPVICLANGSGLAPIISLASAALLRGGFRYPATVLFSAKKSSDIFDQGYFSFLESKFRNFRFIPTLTQEENNKYKQGRITKILPQMFPELEYYGLYIAGSVEFVEDCKKLALSLGAKEENIHVEGFYHQTGKEV